MAGWLKRDNDGSGVNDCAVLESGIENNGDGDVEWSFTEFLKAFLEEVHGVSCLRPLPPVIGEGQTVDLLKLQIVVAKRGGYSRLSRNGLWRSVAADCGYDLRFSAALKLVYVKYLDTLNRWLRKIEKYKGGGGKGVEDRYLRFCRFLSQLESDPKFEKDDVLVELKKRVLESANENMGVVKLNADLKSSVEKSSNANGGIGDVNIYEKQCIDKCGGDDDDDDDNDNDDDDLLMNEDPVSKKRKRECYSGMVNWIREVAKDPGGPQVEPLPEMQKWKCYANELPWKQIILVREAMLSKRNADARTPQSDIQKKQRMNPSMYEDEQCGSERLRCSKRLISAKDSSRKAQKRGGTDSPSSGWQSDDDKQPDSPTYLSNYPKKRVPVGSQYQADLPEFQGVDYESEDQWLGTKFWPLNEAEQTKKRLIERDRIGKGRQDSCGCELVGSVECVRFHVREKRVKLKLELGSAFYLWKVDGMGEKVGLAWTKEEQKKFHHIVQSNPVSSDKYFWAELFKNFPHKGREALVSYYFNVFLLQRRGIQNRTSPGNINSDDEDSEFGPVANRFGAGSIFCSPKKPHSDST